MKVFVYTDPDFIFDQENVFLSKPYESYKDFMKENRDFQIISEYDLDTITEHDSNVKKLKSLNKEALKFLKEGHKQFTPNVTNSLVLDLIAKMEQE